MKLNINYLVDVVEDAGAHALKSYKRRKNNISFVDKGEFYKEKTLREVVLKEDIFLQDLIVGKMLSIDPSVNIYSEELANMDLLDQDYSDIKYILDPLDGTHNFYHGLPYWGISLGILDKDNNPVGGIIVLPALDITIKNDNSDHLSEIKDRGTWRKINTIPRGIKNSLVCYDNQFYKLDKTAIEIYKKITQEVFTTIITGSAVTDSAFIAIGFINARVWNNTNPYDIAAGMAIVKGAGGIVTNFNNKSSNVLEPRLIMSSDIDLHGFIIKQIMTIEG
jgi:myo-inositol-1(or 4)-monophosphatase